LEKEKLLLLLPNPKGCFELPLSLSLSLFLSLSFYLTTTTLLQRTVGFAVAAGNQNAS
jgi:hypothetical protein